MTLHTHTWEHALLSLALEGPSHGSLSDAHGNARRMELDEALLERAYTRCEVITAHHSRSFHMASSLLPPDKRRAVRALYAFCRTSDDIVDEFPGADTSVDSVSSCVQDANAGGDPEAQLRAWRERVLTDTPNRDDLVAVAWTDARLRYGVPQRYAEQLIDGVACDLSPVRYQSFDELAAYCYGVASTVGLMSMHIIGFIGPQAIPYAIKLGVALQMTNILRDIAEDWRTGRLYLPEDDLRTFGLDDDFLQNGKVTAAWRKFMRFQIERNRRLYEEAWPGIAMLDRDGRFAIAAATELYRAILTDIERSDYDVFSRRAHISRWGKLRRLPSIWLRSRRVRTV